MENKGFTLLEVIIAMAIMVLVFASIFSVESGSINASAEAKRMNIVAMLARNAMTESEYKFEGKTFDGFKKEESGAFDPPYESYTWKREVKEIKFPVLNFASPGEETSNAEAISTLSKLISNFLSKAIREVSVTVSWKQGTKEQHFSVSTYWVDLNHEFELSD